jgi:hypothetical protein
MRLKDKVAIVVGAGQTPGDTIGNGLQKTFGSRLTCEPHKGDATAVQVVRSATPIIFDAP